MDLVGRHATFGFLPNSYVIVPKLETYPGKKTRVKRLHIIQEFSTI